MKTLALFDIDGTLIESGQANKKAIIESLKRIADVDLTVEEIIKRFEGMTVYRMLHDKLKEKGFSEKEIKEKIKEIGKLNLKLYKENIKHERLNVLPGVDSLLEILNNKGIKLGIITGNIEEVAWIKIKDQGLDKYFKVGGFGSDAIERGDCLNIAVKRAEKYFKTKFDKIFVVGDTVWDINAAKKTGAVTIGVATGIKDTADDLKKAKADYVFENFKDYEKVAEVILGG